MVVLGAVIFFFFFGERHWERSDEIYTDGGPESIVVRRMSTDKRSARSCGPSIALGWRAGVALRKSSLRTMGHHWSEAPMEGRGLTHPSLSWVEEERFETLFFLLLLLLFFPSPV